MYIKSTKKNVLFKNSFTSASKFKMEMELLKSNHYFQPYIQILIPDAMLSKEFAYSEL